MSNYTKPVVLLNEELAEGVYAASGDCYTATAYVHQAPELGQNKWRVQVNGTHHATDGHHGDRHTATVYFNHVLSSGVNYASVSTKHHNNAYDNIGFADFDVEYAGDDLAVESCVITCNHTCEDGHTW